MVGVGGSGNLAGVAITPNGSDVYVAFPAPNFVSVIDTSTNTAVKRVTVGHVPTLARHHPQWERRLRDQLRCPLRPQQRERHQIHHQHGGGDDDGVRYGVVIHASWE